MQTKTLAAAGVSAPATASWPAPAADELSVAAVAPALPVEVIAGVPRSVRHQRWAVPLACVGGLLVVAPVVAAWIPLNRYSTSPGDATPVNEIVEELPVQSYEPEGDILFVTVSGSSGEVNALAAFEGWLDPDVYFQTKEQKFGKSTPETERLRAFNQMQKAKEIAPYVALTKLGYPTELSEGEVIVDYVQCVEGVPGQCTKEVPSDAVLDAGDQIVSANGTKLSTAEELRAVMATVTPGDSVRLVLKELDQKTLQRATTETTVEATTFAADDDPKRAIFGVLLADTREPELPFDVGLKTDQVGGPSAGLAFTLTLIDELTPGELTGGQKVAVTGTIDFDGNVGAIGGLPQKAVAVKQAGGKYFLVPAGQSDKEIAAAERVLGKGNVIKVATIDDALAALATLGGNADEIGTPGKGYKD